MKTPASLLAWRVENVSADEADIYLYDVIGDSWEGTTASDFVRQLHDLGDIARINLHINSPGGFVSDALAMYNAIRTHPAHITSLIESEAASAASFVAMAADTVKIAANAKIFIHDARGIAIGNSRDMHALGDMLDEESENIASIYAEKTGKPASEWRDAMRANDGVGSTYRGQAAVDIGLADEVSAAPARTARNRTPVRAVAQSEPHPTIPSDFGAAFREAAVLEKPKPSLEALLRKQIATESLSSALKRS